MDDKVCKQCGVMFSKPLASSNSVWVKRKYCSVKCSIINTGIKKGERLPDEWRKKMKGRVPANKGKRSAYSREVHHNWKGGKVLLTCLECSDTFYVRPYRKKIAKFCSMKCKVANQNNNISSENELIRKSSKYKEWRSAVFERDNYTCQMCNIQGGVLHADHIYPFAVFKELRFELSNGRTLCFRCHFRITFGHYNEASAIAWGTSRKVS